jgi:hypothetical protein
VGREEAMTVTDMLPDLTVPATVPWTVVERAAIVRQASSRPSPYPLYWLVGSWSGTEQDEVGRAIVERAIYVSPMATYSDHECAVEIITDALCRWAHPDDIRWCHLPDAGTGGYTVVGRAMRSVSVGEGCSLDDEEDPSD